MIKVVTLLTRKPGMSREAFIEHYETHHRKIGEKYLSGFASKYQRRYLQSAGFREQKGDAPPFDVLMEIWYPDQEALNGALAVLSAEEAQAENAGAQRKRRVDCGTRPRSTCKRLGPTEES